ncbi:MAG: hypothetical protein IJM76_07260 [Lachnospiraceae bacterium]|nr:hypothetical protein [Lachnospiraceae bacterium]
MIVTGPPGAGKTTYCMQQKIPGDICIDLDHIIAALELTTVDHGDHAATYRTALAVYDFLIDQIDKGALTYGRCFIITTNQAKAIQMKTGGQIVNLDPGIEETLRRIDADQSCTPEEKRRRRDLCMQYYYKKDRKRGSRG